MITTTRRPSGGYELPMFNREGVRISLDEWALLMGEGRSTADPTAGYHRVAYDVVGGFTISTAWTGFDSRAYFGGEPLIFETAVMCPDHGDQYIRHATEAEARQAHGDIVISCRLAHKVAGEIRRMMEGEEE